MSSKKALRADVDLYAVTPPGLDTASFRGWAEEQATAGGWTDLEWEWVADGRGGEMGQLWGVRPARAEANNGVHASASTEGRIRTLERQVRALNEKYAGHIHHTEHQDYVGPPVELTPPKPDDVGPES